MQTNLKVKIQNLELRTIYLNDKRTGRSPVLPYSCP